MSRREALAAVLRRHPRLELGHLPTPFEPLRRLTSFLDGPQLWIKRDDATGLGVGGNKVRALEYVAADAVAKEADVLITAGVIQSNSVRQVAAAAAKLGLGCHFGVITDRVPNIDRDYRQTGNILLDHLYGATHEPMTIGDDRTSKLAEIALRIKASGRRPYIVPYGCANRLGAIGYLGAALEIADQALAMDVTITHIVHASGSGGTQAGLIAGLAMLNLDVEVIGIDIDAEPEGVHRRVASILRELADEVGLEFAPLEKKISIESSYSGDAYGVADQSTLDAIMLAARMEGLLVDPVYSGKALAGMCGLIREGRLAPDAQIVFLHTGGSPAIYAYRSLFPELAA
ncbi:D-cysteine desulfhydrase family protein [Pseudonocardia zijingensis]|uniref:D-cysteine desulfhydrase n=2 Tax=Pseudonocardia zijingensis TaxID=153376 RepID=A0ABP3YP11_9PSEU